MKELDTEELQDLLTDIQEALVLFSLIDKSDLASDTMGLVAEFRIKYAL
jgi:hypothetical protein